MNHRIATVKKFEELKKELISFFAERKKVHAEMKKLEDLIKKNKDEFWKLYEEIEAYNKLIPENILEDNTTPTIYEIIDDYFHAEEYSDRYRPLELISDEWEKTDKMFHQDIAKVKLASIRKAMRNR